MDFHTPLRQIKGVGEKTEKMYQKIGVYTVGDILLHFPRAYQEYPEISEVSEDKVGEMIAFVGTLRTPAITKRGRNMDFTLATTFCEDVAIECVWFRMPYIRSQLKVKEPFVYYGKLIKDGYKLKLEQPVIYSYEKYQKLRTSLQPIYTLTKGLTNVAIRKVLAQIFDELQGQTKNQEHLESKDALDKHECLPVQVIAEEKFPSYIDALQMVHFPETFDALALGRRRLVYQEFFYFILHSRIQEKEITGVPNTWQFGEGKIADSVIKQLPYELTKGQSDTLSRVRGDLRGSVVSQRLIQGDVGSGKTIVAFLAMLDAVEVGYQAAIMAPTEVLAKQHEQSFREMLEEYQLPYEVVCLTGSMTAKEKRLAYEKIESQDSLLIVGTHALIQEKVVYKNLAVVITDEQHRFGVKQRERLSSKGEMPHVIVMSATPIPRTLAMILYGNMQISAIKELPAKRLPIKTCVIKENMRKKAYEMIAKEVGNGHQGYIICPLVEASETTEAENVLDYTKKLQAFYGKAVRVTCLHGKMPAKEKNQIMNDFADHNIDVLVSTTVVEVGINVPNATVMMIENANRFGLAQLHQLRGRVGRGQWQSYCILMDQSKEDKISKRLDIMNQSNDGFFIAEEDLKLRGPGDFFGIRQSGDLNFKLADIIGDADVLTKAAEDVGDLLSEDENLEHHPAIKDKLNSFVTEYDYIL